MLHSENVRLYQRLALKLKGIQRVLEFNQSNGLKPYIERNTQKELKMEKWKKENDDKDGKSQ